jgi:hypothetical protein
MRKGWREMRWIPWHSQLGSRRRRELYSLVHGGRDHKQQQRERERERKWRRKWMSSSIRA